MGRREHDGSGFALPVGAEPVRCRDAPTVTGNEPRESVLRHWRGEVVADAELVFEEFGRDNCADRVAAEVLGAR